MATVTLKNLPDDLHQRLKARARAHRRSVNAELIHCLETVLSPRKLSAEERLARFRGLRPRIESDAVEPEAVLAAIDDGRP